MCPVAVAEEEKDEVSPMQQIQKKRSKWRSKKEDDLEDTWGSLTLFNKSHRGRLSVDMTGQPSLSSCLPLFAVCLSSPLFC